MLFEIGFTRITIPRTDPTSEGKGLVGLGQLLLSHCTGRTSEKCSHSSRPKCDLGWVLTNPSTMKTSMMTAKFAAEAAEARSKKLDEKQKELAKQMCKKPTFKKSLKVRLIEQLK